MYEGLIEFIDSLPEEPASEDLEEAANQYALRDSQAYKGVHCTYTDDKIAFIAGAKWQKEQDKKTIELAEDHAMLAGMNKMKEEMMKALIGGEVVKDIHNQLSVESEPLNNAFGDIKFGDKVKIIIVKTEQQ